jgi:hypothetical protein
LRDDPLPEARQRAVNALAHVAHRLGKPCPLAVVEAFMDKDELTRWQANACAPIFKKNFAPGCVDVLLRGTTSADSWIRMTCVIYLGHAGGKDPRARAAIEKARLDKVFDVSHMARWALFNLDDKLDDLLPYVIRLREEPEVFRTAPADNAEARQKERENFNLYLGGTMLQYLDWIESRGPELAGLLVKLLDDDKPLMRRGAANLIAVSVLKLPPPVPLKTFLLPTEEEKKPEPSPMPSRTFFELKKRAVDKKLTALAEKDPDAGVREAARKALDSLARVSDKKP